MKLNYINPHDQSIIGSLNISTQTEIDKTLKKAKKAFETWKEISLEKRISYIQKYRQILEKNIDKIAKLTTLEMGKPIQQSRDDVTWELSFLDYYIQTAPKALAEETVYKKGQDNFRLTYEPYGVCACIAPWNFPISMVNSGLIPALLAGNTAIVKPSEYTSLTQKLNVDLLNQSGLPEGVANTLIGDGKVGQALVDAKIDLVWFTGSTKVGRQIYEKAGQKFIKVLLELGGSSPAIIFADADLGNALDNLYLARFLNCGQVCTAIKRLFVQKSVYQKVVDLFVKKLQTVKVGNPLDKETDIGPLVSAKQLALLKAQLADAIKKGAKIEIGGEQPKNKALAKGNYFEPTIVSNIKPNMRLMTEEVFGPILPIVSFETEIEAIKLANQTEYGLSAEVYTKDLAKGERVAAQLEAGTVAINTDDFFKPQCPFGGFKQSGMGKEYGKIGMQEFSKIKVIAVHK